jgi:hypothetical protein
LKASLELKLSVPLIVSSSRISIRHHKFPVRPSLTKDDLRAHARIAAEIPPADASMAIAHPRGVTASFQNRISPRPGDPVGAREIS